METWNPDIFRKNDIRGIYKKDFDLKFIKALAFSFVKLCFSSRDLKKKLENQKLSLAIGHDARLSSPEIAKHFSKFLNQAGSDLLFLGLTPSPVCFFTSYFMKNIHASIVITASHNPPDFNGFKMILNKKPVCGRKILELKKLVYSSSFSEKSPSKRGKSTFFDIKSPYIAFHKERISPRPNKNIVTSKKVSAVSRFSALTYPTSAKLNPFIFKKETFKKLKTTPLKNIAIDFANGASGPITKKLFKALNLPFKIHYLYSVPDGRFPNHPPDPSLKKNLRDLKKLLKEKKCELGVAFDGDGDRLVILGKSGKVLAGDELMALFISDILSNQKPKNPHFVVDVKCGDWFFDFLKRKKVKFSIGKSGHSLIREKSLKEKAIFGGELSGHFFFCDDFFPIDDGIYGLLRLIDICFRKNKTPEEIFLKKSSLESPEIRKPIPNMDQAKKNLRDLKKFYKTQKKAKLCFIDGLRVSFKAKAWGLARISTTQNEWTFRFGGKNIQALKQIKKQFYRYLQIENKTLLKKKKL